MNDTKSDIWLQVIGTYLMRHLFLGLGARVCFSFCHAASATFYLLPTVSVRLIQYWRWKNLLDLLLRHGHKRAPFIHNYSVSLKLLLLNLKVVLWSPQVWRIRPVLALPMINLRVYLRLSVTLVLLLCLQICDLSKGTWVAGLLELGLTTTIQLSGKHSV